MTKQELKKADNSTLVYELVMDYSRLCLNVNSGGGIKALDERVKFLTSMLLDRGLLTEHQKKVIDDEQ